MSIRKRNWVTSKGEHRSAWLVDYRDAAGNRLSKQFARKKEAEAWQTNAVWQVSQGIHTPDSQSITVEQAITYWLDRAENDGLERSTITSYEATARLHILPFLGTVKLSKLSRPMIEEFKASLLQSRSKSMTQRAIKYLAQALNEAMNRHLIGTNVAKGVRVRQDRSPRPEIPSKHELQAIVDTCNCEERALFLTVILTGLRASELRGLTWSSIDFARKNLTVSQRADFQNKIGLPKSKAGNRTIPLPDSAVKALKEWRLASPASAMDLVFPSKKGTPQYYSNLMKRTINPVQVRAGVSTTSTDKDGRPYQKAKYPLHAFRHAAASNWINLNLDLKRLQCWMGHESIQLTIDTYGHLMQDDDKDASFAAASERALFY